MTISVSTVEVSMPPTTQVPIGARDSAPSPSPIAMGIMPAIVEKAVIRIGRNRTGPALQQGVVVAHSAGTEEVGVVDQQDRVLGHQPHQHDHADHAEDVQRAAGQGQVRPSAPPTESGNENMIVNGCRKLSNWAASTM